ncbi:MAG: hypothetical protein ACRDRA_06475 [Pseudonocardiaceae bacterium]
MPVVVTRHIFPPLSGYSDLPRTFLILEDIMSSTHDTGPRV